MLMPKRVKYVMLLLLSTLIIPIPNSHKLSGRVTFTCVGAPRTAGPAGGSAFSAACAAAGFGRTGQAYSPGLINAR